MLTSKFGRGKGLMTGNDKNDKVFTPLPIAKQIINTFELYGKVLDGFMGGVVHFTTNCPIMYKKIGARLTKGEIFLIIPTKLIG